MLAVAASVVALISPTRSPSGEIPTEPLTWSVAFSLAVVALFFVQGLYRAPLHLDMLNALRSVFGLTGLAAALTMATRVVVSDEAYVAAETVRHWLPALALLALGRSAMLWYEARARRAGGATSPTLVVGAGDVGRRAARRLLDEPELGLRPVAFLDDAPREADDKTAALPVFKLDTDIAELAARFGVSHVIIAFSGARHDELLALTRRCWELGLAVSMVPRLFEIEGERFTIDHLGGLPLVGVRQTDPRGWRIHLKYALDWAVSGTILICALPVIFVLALVVLVSMGRPILFRQRRVGLDGRVFDMLKFRTMRGAPDGEETDAEWAAAQLAGLTAGEAAPANPRETSVGHVLRRYSLDELPQLWNVLRGDMSLIGPRPERVRYAQEFGSAVYRYDERHRLKAGLTGWTQIHGLRGQTPLADRVEWDNYYIENWTLWMDFKIALRTLPAMLHGNHEGVSR